ncbi:MAG: hypothetical protein A2845_01540 [Candidatus Lloydbacteria bacterium RIFCSPHIGHO2_01_FULL_49_22]|uniref:Uncharacterized protein n=1 Tax=Candidatus Lloydbacteria bacterium RIFCSPHIGHO2_01_FULL_49_22 TaxID=1798658 RepID=A0A1G2CXH2_9BACT|nr:MAG: hypothetical protein A2845_01540 [Candidatus Lloydbacteria bacterium RIFCSPHIGHO2_01_FULL_49_22]OGZ09980.1 MAG: hypothetical protein A3C14_04705 [Candidatus Lloydbacteria bacterium RIFCSPHIGHO2_02_FULL_50_18]
MSKELNNITDTIMGKIHGEQIKPRPKIYFILGSLLTFLGLVSSIVVSVFLFGLLRFLSRSHGPMGEYRLEQFLSSFPWWAPVFAILGLVLGIWLLRRYDFSYKIDFKIIIAGFIVAIITAGILVDMTGVNDAWVRRGPAKEMMQKYLNGDGARFDDAGWRR